MTAYPVQGAIPAMDLRLAGLQAPLIGRDREAGPAGRTAGRSVGDGNAAPRAVYGPAGIGKSRLIREFLTAARERRQLSRSHRPLPGDRTRNHLLGSGRDSSPGVRHLARRLGAGSRTGAPRRRSRGPRRCRASRGGARADCVRAGHHSRHCAARQSARSGRAACGGRRAGARLAAVRYGARAERPTIIVIEDLTGRASRSSRCSSG